MCSTAELSSINQTPTRAARFPNPRPYLYLCISVQVGATIVISSGPSADFFVSKARHCEAYRIEIPNASLGHNACCELFAYV